MSHLKRLAQWVRPMWTLIVLVASESNRPVKDIKRSSSITKCLHAANPTNGSRGEETTHESRGVTRCTTAPAPPSPRSYKHWFLALLAVRAVRGCPKLHSPPHRTLVAAGGYPARPPLGD